MFVYKHTETIEYAKNQPTFLGKMQTLRANNSNNFTIKGVEFSGYYFYMNLNIYGKIFKSALVYL